MRLLLADIGGCRLWLLLLGLLADPGLGPLLHLHGYNALHGFLDIVFVKVGGYLRRAQLLQLLILLPQLLPLHLDQILQLRRLLLVVLLAGGSGVLLRLGHLKARLAGHSRG